MNVIGVAMPIREQIEDLLQWIPDGVISPRLPTDHLSIFYHTVSDDPLPHVRHLFGYKSTAAFERDLEFISRQFVPISHHQVLAHQLSGEPLPDRAIMLSFDDGLSECFDVVRPLLLRYGMPCSFFVVKNFLDNKSLMHRCKVSLCQDKLESTPSGTTAAVLAEFTRRFPDDRVNPSDPTGFFAGLNYAKRDRINALCELCEIDVEGYLRQHKPYLTTEQARQLHDDGFTLGGHTVNHCEPTSVSFAEYGAEIVESCEAVCEITGSAEAPFAITFNGLELKRSELATLRERNPKISLYYDTNDLLPDRDFIVNRIWVDTPRKDREGQSNLAHLIKRARVLEPIRRLNRIRRKRPH